MREANRRHLGINERFGVLEIGAIQDGYRSGFGFIYRAGHANRPFFGRVEECSHGMISDFFSLSGAKVVDEIPRGLLSPYQCSC